MKELFKRAFRLFKSGDVVGGIIGLTVAVIVCLGAGIPITQQVIKDEAYNFTGITKTIITFIPVFMALTLLVAAVGVMRGQT